MFLFCTISEILSVTSPKLQVTWHRTHPLQGVVYHAAYHACATTRQLTSLCTSKFEMTSFIHSKDMMGTQNLNMGHVTMTMILSGVLVVGWDLLWSTYVPNLKLLSPPVTKIRWRDTVEIEMVVRVTEIDWKKSFHDFNEI